MAAGAGAGRRRWARPIPSCPRPGADHRDAAAGGGPLPQTLERGLRLLEEPTASCRPAACSRRGGLQALRHLRLSARPHPGRAARPGHRRRHATASTRRWSASAPRRAAPGRARARPPPRPSGSSFASDVGATEFLGYDAETAEGKVVALVRDGKRVVEAQVGQSVVPSSNQTPFYGEFGGQVGDTGVDVSRRPALIVVTDTQKKLGDLHRPSRPGRSGTLKVGDDGRARGRSRAARRLRANHSATHLLHDGAAPAARRARHAEGLAGRARPAALRHQPPEAADARRDRGDRGRGQPRGPRELPRSTRI